MLTFTTCIVSAQGAQAPRRAGTLAPGRALSRATAESFPITGSPIGKGGTLAGWPAPRHARPWRPRWRRQPRVRPYSAPRAKGP